MLSYTIEFFAFLSFQIETFLDDRQVERAMKACHQWS